MTLELNPIDDVSDFLAGGKLNQDADNRTIRRYKAVVGHLSCDLNGEAVILNMKNGKYYGVNSVGASIWAAIQAPVSFGDLQSAIMAEYEVDEATCRQAVRSFLEKLTKEGLIEFFDE